MKKLAEKSVFSVNKKLFYWNDVFLSAYLNGEWYNFTSELIYKSSLATEYLNTENFDPNPKIKDALTLYRYSHDLESADDTIKWLKERDLTLEELKAYLLRQILNDGRYTQPVHAPNPNTAEWTKCLRPEGIFSETFENWLQRFAAAASLYTPEDQNRLDFEFNPAEQSFLQFLNVMGADQKDLEFWKAKANLVRSLQNRLAHFLHKRITPRLITDQINRNHVPWTWIDYSQAVFKTQSAAKEALMCVREGSDLINLAIETEAAVSRLAHFLERAPWSIDAGEKMLAAGSGEIIGPIELENGYAVLCLNKKEFPTPGNSEVYRRAAASVEKQILKARILDNIDWQGDIYV